jgi:hypothetical protein
MTKENIWIKFGNDILILILWAGVRKKGNALNSVKFQLPFLQGKITGINGVFSIKSQFFRKKSFFQDFF